MEEMCRGEKSIDWPDRIGNRESVLEASISSPREQVQRLGSLSVSQDGTRS